MSGKVAFEGSGPQGSHIWVVAETGLGAVDLGGVSGAQDSSPTWSPTGDRLAFSRFSSPGGLPRSDIWVMNKDGMNPLPLTGSASLGGAPTGVYEAPAWSPDGTKIAYHTASAVGVMNADGTNFGEIAGSSNNQFRSPTWSPDSTKLAFTNFYYDGLGRMTTVVSVMNSDGSGSRSDLVSSAENGFVDADPAWSPDGTRILFVSNRSGTLNVWVMNTDGSGTENLTNSTFAEGGPSWSPDGSSIAFSSSRSGGSHIFTMQMPRRRITGMFFHRYPTLTYRLATTRVVTWLMAEFVSITDLTAALPTVACGHPTWSAA